MDSYRNGYYYDKKHMGNNQVHPEACKQEYQELEEHKREYNQPKNAEYRQKKLRQDWIALKE